MAYGLQERQPFGTLSGSSFPVVTGTAGGTISKYDVCYFDASGAHKETSSGSARQRWLALSDMENGDTGQFVMLGPDTVVLLATSDTGTRVVGRTYDFDDSNQRIASGGAAGSAVAVTVVGDSVGQTDDGHHLYPCVLHCVIA